MTIFPILGGFHRRYERKPEHFLASTALAAPLRGPGQAGFQDARPEHTLISVHSVNRRKAVTPGSPKPGGVASRCGPRWPRR